MAKSRTEIQRERDIIIERWIEDYQEGFITAEELAGQITKANAIYDKQIENAAEIITYLFVEKSYIMVNAYDEEEAWDKYNHDIFEKKETETEIEDSF